MLGKVVAAGAAGAMARISISEAANRGYAARMTIYRAIRRREAGLSSCMERENLSFRC